MATGQQTIQAAEGQWHKLLLIAMVKMGVKHLAISPEDIMALAPDSAIVLQEGRDGDGLLHLSVVDSTTARELQRFGGVRKDGT